MSDLKESLFEAIRVIAQAEDSKLTFTKTIEATIFDNSQAPDGIYQVQYQDGVFPAYTDADNKVTYNVGDAVLVLIPDGDFSKQKRILGKKSQIGGSDSVSTSTSLDRIDWIGPDWSIWLDYNKQDPFVGKGLIAGGEQESLVLFDGFTQEDTTDEIIFKRYFNACHAFLIKCNFRTDFPQDTITEYYGGNYGLRLTFQKDNTEYVFILDLDNMNGDPYNYKDPATQYILYQYDNEALAGATITKIELFQENFNVTPQDHADIFATNLNLSFVQEIEDLGNGYSMNIITPQGNVVSAQEITLQPQLKLDGQEISYDTAMWFIEDMSIKVGNENYSPYAGIGWRNLNVNGTLTIEDGDIFGTTQYKCVIIKGALAFDKIIFIYKLNSLYEFEINREGPDKNDFVTLRVNQLTEMPGPFTYAWAKTDAEGNTFSLSGNSDTYQFNINEIYLNSTFYCSIYNASGDLVYTARIYIDKTIEEDNDIAVVFVGNYIFAYDANGDIDYSSYSQPHNLTAEIALQDANDSILTATWVFPLPDDSMVTIADGTQTGTDEDGKPIVEVGTSVNNPSVDFKIAPKYNINKLNNWIDLRLTTVAGQEYTVRKEIICIKTGNSGTNGTKYYAFLDFQEGHDHVAVNDSAQIAVIEPHVFEDGAARNDFTITYSLGGIRGDDYRFLNITNGNNNSCIATYLAKTGVEWLDSSNFVTATVEIDGTELHCFIAVPVLISGTWVPLGDTSADNLLGKRYITSVEYNPSGENPSYDKNAVINREYWTTLEANDKFKELEQDDVAFEPVAKYNNDGMCGNILATSADCQVLWPVVFYLNTYGNESINGWDGVSIELDEESGYILSPVVGAGEKREDTNEFTGVLMGTVGFFDGASVDRKTGLFGFAGEDGQTFFLDAETGDITLGAPGRGQLSYTVNSGILRLGSLDKDNKWYGLELNGQDGKIQSGNYEASTTGDVADTKGMMIDLANGVIDAKGFHIDEGGLELSGIIEAIGGRIGNWKINEGRLEGTSTDPNGGRIVLDADNAEIRGYPGDWTGEGSRWTINPNGITTEWIDANGGSIGGWSIDENALSAGDTLLSYDGTAVFGPFSIYYSEDTTGSHDSYFGPTNEEWGMSGSNSGLCFWTGYSEGYNFLVQNDGTVRAGGDYTTGRAYDQTGWVSINPDGNIYLGNAKFDEDGLLYRYVNNDWELYGDSGGGLGGGDVTYDANSFTWGFSDGYSVTAENIDNSSDVNWNNVLYFDLTNNKIHYGNMSFQRGLLDSNSSNDATGTNGLDLIREWLGDVGGNGEANVWTNASGHWGTYSGDTYTEFTKNAKSSSGVVVGINGDNVEYWDLSFTNGLATSYNDSNTDGSKALARAVASYL